MNKSCDNCDGPATTTYNGYPACSSCAYEAAVEDGRIDEQYVR